MEITDNITLMSGIFEAEDARDILLSLITNNINFHTLRSFSAQERFGVSDCVSERQITALSKARLEIQDNLSLAKSLGCKISVDSIIRIRLLP
ncbi:hypothetical protein SAMN05660293_05628 [Dyadobacter psychrophilus]|uniref:Uncharacterized protein n=2 Tax=Dyadobacter TaxID=120831 RepID=A0A916JFX7_9BACT|nr:hypothetical protein DYBT9275_04865 [Dyadobacter sp. CECT 9275]SKC20283.1 hypothetical protein SAMN05660293_05628 [Dyadobacter psychrophilus]